MNTREVVVDSCVAFKWFAGEGEPGVADALELLDRHAREELFLIAPASLLWEVTNALRYSPLGREQVVEAARALGLFRIRTFDITPERAGRAVELAFDWRISFYDAVFLQLAEERGCPLVSADRAAFGRIPADVADVVVL